MTEEIQFRDTISYPKNSHIERRRHERRATRRVVEELGATQVIARESETDDTSYHVFGRVRDTKADLGRIQQILQRRGGRRFVLTSRSL